MDALPREGAQLRAAADLRARFLAFVVEQFPFALDAAREAFDAGHGAGARLRELLARDLTAAEVAEATPGVAAAARHEQELDRVERAVDGFFRREAIRASITPDEKRWMLAGIVLTRAVDNQLKQIFLSGDLKWREGSFQGKGFRSLGQEAIYGAALRLKRGPAFGAGVRNGFRTAGGTMGFVLGKSSAWTGSARRTSGSDTLGCGIGEAGTIVG